MNIDKHHNLYTFRHHSLNNPSWADYGSFCPIARIQTNGLEQEDVPIGGFSSSIPVGLRERMGSNDIELSIDWIDPRINEEHLQQIMGLPSHIFLSNLRADLRDGSMTAVFPKDLRAAELTAKKWEIARVKRAAFDKEMNDRSTREQIERDLRIQLEREIRIEMEERQRLNRPIIDEIMREKLEKLERDLREQEEKGRIAMASSNHLGYNLNEATGAVRIPTENAVEFDPVSGQLRVFRDGTWQLLHLSSQAVLVESNPHAVMLSPFNSEEFASMSRREKLKVGLQLVKKIGTEAATKIIEHYAGKWVSEAFKRIVSKKEEPAQLEESTHA